MKNVKKIFFVLSLLLAAGTMVFAGGAKESNLPSIDLNADRAGIPIVIPEKVERIISMAPSATEILIDLGLTDKIIAGDTNTQKDGLLKQDIPYFDMMKPDAEKLIALKPDVVFISGMSNAKGNTPFSPLIDAGICVISIPSSSSIEAIYLDIAYIAAVVKQEGMGAKIISNMKKEIEAIRKKGASIAEDKKKKVYFEIGAAPYMYSLGTGTFIHEMIEIIGAKNILADQKSWIAVSDEMVLSKDPDIILTNVSYIPNPIDEIMARPGWGTLKAVKGKQVFAVDNNSSSRPNHNIIKALKEMAKAVYPEIYK
ncbi:MULTISPECIES: ABC transporter substrate-binding protein [unclassified Treponema]|uniref:ABC transporter substrate-binding protein n=1 Tax=unclassified Treponema TaxID=2638727 RepID=UPI0020A5582A|nr:MULTISPECIES: ABC transporter substrate-binding protein [unclassified Treponema]UTC67516.1 ABC transporter substrate-binding protein [Treponema sp. OMZ 789]UTC70244.1 ABC transporter substrate-binding protein [Treponema sp. OMZ 790]UTC72959.1 ABC transporter substrate-binding protein [Treponema sp. OMZ 791]